jgi:hypothetical protein
VTARASALALACTLAAAPLAAQVPRYLGADAGLSRVRFRSTTPSAKEVLTGVVAGGQARARLGAFAVEAAYAQGRLSADTGVVTERDLVDGSVFLSARPLPWLVVRAGPHARAYAASAGGTERWMHWEGRVRVEGAIVPGMLQAHVEGALALASDVNVLPGASGARGGEVGLTLRPPQSQLWVRLGYLVDQAKVRNGARSETVEMVALSVGYGAR